MAMLPETSNGTGSRSVVRASAAIPSGFGDMGSPSEREPPLAPSLFLSYWLARVLVTGLCAGLLLLDQGFGWIASSFFGAALGVSFHTLLSCLTWHIWMRITRGAPFRVGERVVITDGPLKSEVGEVRQLCEGRCAVWVALEREGNDSSDLYYFEWDQICRADWRVGLRRQPQ